jgi:hypothetical protein
MPDLPQDFPMVDRSPLKLSFSAAGIINNFPKHSSC